MSETTTTTYRGDLISKDELINLYMKLQRLDQLGGMEWITDYHVSNNPEDWFAEEVDEIDELIKEDL